MKQTKTTAVKRAKKQGVQAAKRVVQKRRPLHRRVALHPFTIMVLLCAGVLIIGVTLRSFADSYSVTATVPAPVPSAAATITYPLASEHVQTSAVVVQGGCSDQSYVSLSDNGQFSGVSQCSSRSFQIQTSLSPGANQLDAQVYSLTDQPGPIGTPVTVYYDQTTVVPVSTVTTTAPAPVPASPMTTVGISSVDNGELLSGGVLMTSTNPTVSGWAPPWSTVTVLFHSSPMTCVTQADAQGQWSCTLDQALTVGIHHVYVSAITPAGRTVTYPPFEITASPSVPNLLRTSNDTPMSVRANYHYQVYVGSQTVSLALGLTGGTAPYTITTDWGDGTTTTLTRSDASPFTVSHQYAAPSQNDKNYAVLVHATDARQSSSYVQLSCVVRGAGIVLVSSSNTLDQYLTNAQHWLWLIWPTYMIVVLMSVGYYLGERQEYQSLMAKKRMRTAGKSR